MSYTINEMALMVAGMSQEDKDAFFAKVEMYADPTSRLDMHEHLKLDALKSTHHDLKEKLILYMQATGALPHTKILDVDHLFEYHITEEETSGASLEITMMRTDSPPWLDRVVVTRVPLKESYSWSLPHIVDSLRHVQIKEYVVTISFIADYVQAGDTASELELQLFVKQVYDSGIDNCNMVLEYVEKVRRLFQTYQIYLDNMKNALIEYMDAHNN